MKTPKRTLALLTAAIVTATAASMMAQAPPEPDLEALVDQASKRLPADLDQSSIQTYIDGVAAYIYGYSLVAIATTERLATNVKNATVSTGRSPINQFYKATQLPVGSSYTDVVLPSTTTMYAPSFIDLTNQPLILHIPPISPDRYFIFELLDAWTNVSRQSPGSRVGTGPGDYALVGPNNTKPLPAGLAGEIHFDTNTAWIITRVYTTGTDEDQKLVYEDILKHLTLTPLSVYPKPYVAPHNIPVNPSVDMRTQPIKQVDSMDACAFFGTMSAMMATNAPRAIDTRMVPRLTRLNIIPGQFSCSNLATTSQGQTDIKALELAVLTAKQIMASQGTPSETSTHWSVALNVGDYSIRYLLRALVAQNALGANRAQDAVYGYTRKDGSGNQLKGTSSYVIHFNPETSQHAPGEIPPIDGNGFWSITLYQDKGTLNDNTEGPSWHALSTKPVEGHTACLNPDRSLDIYVQPTKPSNDLQACNWLATPPPSANNDDDNDNFILFLRLYWPDPSVTRRINHWIPPGVQPPQ